jgi:hypothetical protein
MAPFDRHDLEALVAPQSPPCVSVFLPAPGPVGGPIGIRLKNLMREAEGQLPPSPDRAALLEPLAALARSDASPHPAEGLALFRSAGFFAQYRLRGPLPEQVVVADTFHVRPLLRFLQEDHRYYVLALSLNRVELYESTPRGLERVDLPGLPGSLSEATPASKEGPSFLNLHTAGGRAVFHGHGSPELTRKGELPRFFRTIDRALWSRLRGERAPLLLAGVAAHWPVYRAISRYPHVAAAGIEGNPSDLGATALSERAAPIVRELFRSREERVLKEFGRARGRGRAAIGLEAVARGAASGRVRLLLLARGVPLWGELDAASGRVRRSDEPVERKDDVLDDVAELVLTRGGDVLVLAPDRMPDGSEVAALLRW